MSEATLDVSRERLASFCQHRKIVELALYGDQAARGPDPEETISLLVEFAPDADWNLSDCLQMEEELGDLLGRTVELMNRDTLEQSPNAIRVQHIEQTARTIYRMPHWTRDQAALFDMKRAAWMVQQFTTEQSSREAFQQGLKTQSAVLYQLVLLGEGAKQLTPGYRVAREQVDWRMLMAIRDRILRPGNEVDLEQIWQFARHEVPTIFRQLEALLPSH